MKISYYLGVLFSFWLLGCSKDEEKTEPDSEVVEEVVDTNIFYADSDNDSFGNPEVTLEAEVRPEGYVYNNQDCDDTDPLVHPNADEIYNDGIDNNCDGIILDNNPTAFEVGDDLQIGLNFAAISWSESTSEFESIILYKVFVNDEEVISGLNNTHYTIGDLDPGTLYNVQIVAYNEYDEFPLDLEFTTKSLSAGLVRLAKIEINNLGGDNYLANYHYDSDNKLIQILFDNVITGLYQIDIQYDDLDRITEYKHLSYYYVSGFVYSSQSYLDYTYYTPPGDVVITFGYYLPHSGDCFSDSYSHYVDDNFNTLLFDCTESYNAWIGSMNRDSESRVTAVSAAYASNEWEHTLVYSGNNLVKITDAISGDVYEIAYDIGPNFHMDLPNGRNGFFIPDVGSLESFGYILPPEELWPLMRNTTLAFQHENTNNPVTYIKNGSVIRSLEYEYLIGVDHPTKIIVDGNPEKFIKLYYDVL